MTPEITISLDAMGGDAAPGMVVGGAALARERHPNVRFLLFGDEARITPLLSRHRSLRDAASVRHTDQQVKSTDRPSQALRQGRQTSMRLAIDAVASGEAGGVVSAGNTGALMAMSKFVLKPMKGIDRPALCGFLPTLRGESVMLDLGANVECDEDNLVQFAIMGAAFARTILGLPRPTVGLLNVGEEELKGNEAVKGAAAILNSAALPLRFHGFIEGNDIAKGTTDVVVTDGFSGNVALKTMEGTATLFSQFLRTAFSQSLMSKVGYMLAKPAIMALRERIDPRHHNGGVFLGLNGISVKSHGGMDDVGFATAIGLAVDMVADDLIGRITADMAQFSDHDKARDRAAAQ
ncbi:MAG: phosphate acyltransferase PlsX [Alphaproteobacteria bacterium]|nr:phosphate acyltransferase PlsX [Alphaproteobacteria bacterium]